MLTLWQRNPLFDANSRGLSQSPNLKSSSESLCYPLQLRDPRENDVPVQVRGDGAWRQEMA